jgi:hypothetical protein
MAMGLGKNVSSSFASSTSLVKFQFHPSISISVFQLLPLHSAFIPCPSPTYMFNPLLLPRFCIADTTYLLAQEVHEVALDVPLRYKPEGNGFYSG